MQYYRTLLLVVFSLISFSGFTQNQLLSTQISGKEKPIKLNAVSVSIEVVGNLSVTTLDMSFYNPNDRVMEGEFSFPLNEHQEIIRYALDVNGKLREGVVIEKVKARQVFEALVRKNIDPGIAEKTKGNFFKTRIYPLPAKGYKRAVISFQELLTADKSGDIEYSLSALKNSEQLANFKLQVQSLKSSGKPANKTNNNSFKFDQVGEYYRMDFERKNYTPDETINFTIPLFRKIDKQVIRSEFDGEKYFMVNLKKVPEKLKTLILPKSIFIYWDQSHSGSARDIDKELAFLEAYLSAIPGTKKVTVQGMGNHLGAVRSFNFNDNNRTLIGYLKNQKYDGATYFDEINLVDDVDQILFFSDGVITLGKERINRTKTPVYTISSKAGSNTSFLRYLAEATNGNYINLNKQSIADATSLLTSNRETFKFEEDNCSALHMVSLSNSHHVLLGKITGENPGVKISYGTWKTVVNLEANEENNEAIPKIWASKELGELDKRHEFNNEKIKKIGRKFNLVTRNTSFIVLDNVTDYVQYEIEPPTELKFAYDSLLMIKKREESREIDNVAEQNLTRFETLKNWYDKVFDKLDLKDKVDPDVPLFDEPFEELQAQELDDVEVVEEVETESAAFINVENSLSGVVRGVAVRESTEKKIAKNSSKNAIKVLPWEPKADYLDSLRVSKIAEYENIYFYFKKLNATRPSFYIQVSDFLYRNGSEELSNRILSTVLEIDLANPELLKIVGNMYRQRGEFQLAVKVFEEIKDLRPEEPQSYRDLALAYEEAGRCQEAFDNYHIIMKGRWERFENIKDLVLVEINGLINRCGDEIDISKLDPELIKNIKLDVRVVISWSSNDNDVDLWVIDPNEEKCYYQHTKTRIGGVISSDFTRGYGPESFKIKEAIEGKYLVKVKYFSDSRQTVAGPVTIFASFYTNFGSKDQIVKHQVVQLEDNKEVMEIGEFYFEKE